MPWWLAPTAISVGSSILSGLTGPSKQQKRSENLEQYAYDILTGKKQLNLEGLSPEEKAVFESKLKRITGDIMGQGKGMINRLNTAGAATSGGAISGIGELGFKANETVKQGMEDLVMMDAQIKRQDKSDKMSSLFGGLPGFRESARENDTGSMFGQMGGNLSNILLQYYMSKEK